MNRIKNIFTVIIAGLATFFTGIEINSCSQNPPATRSGYINSDNSESGNSNDSSSSSSDDNEYEDDDDLYEGFDDDDDLYEGFDDDEENIDDNEGEEGDDSSFNLNKDNNEINSIRVSLLLGNNVYKNFKL